ARVGQIGGRYAAHGIGNATADQHELVGRIGAIVSFGQAELQKRAVEQLAGKVAGERAPGAVCAADSGSEADDEGAGVQVAEARDGRVEPTRVGSPVGLTVADEARAERAVGGRGARRLMTHATSWESVKGSAGVWRIATGARIRGSVWRRVNSGAIS